MRLRREAKFGLWLLGALAAAVAAFFAGGILKPEEEPHYVFDVTAPAYGGDLGSLAAMSPGGFTGFEDLVPGGSRTVLGGRIVEISGDSLTLETPSGVQTEMRLGEAPRLTRLESAGRDVLVPGATVLVKLGDAEDVAAAVLVLAPP